MKSKLIITVSTLIIIGIIGLYHLLRKYIPKKISGSIPLFTNLIAVIFVAIILADHWLPLGPTKGFVRSLIFVALLIGGLLIFFRIFQKFYPRILGWCLEHKILFLSIPVCSPPASGFMGIIHRLLSSPGLPLFRVTPSPGFG